MSANFGSRVAPISHDEADSSNSSMWVRFFCACAFLFFLGALSHLFDGSEGAGTGPLNYLFLPIALLFQLVAVLLLAGPKRVHKTIELLGRNRPLILALAIVSASTIWSIDPELTFRRVLALLGTTAVGLLIYIEVGRGAVLRFFAISLALFVATAVVLSVAVPELGTHVYGKHSGDWRGLLTFKNQAAWVTAIFLLAWIGVRKQGKLKALHYPLLAAGLLMLFYTGSATGIAALAVGSAVLLIMNLYSRSRLLRPLIVTGTGVTILMVAMNYQALFSWSLNALGRDESLTGRTSLWRALWPLIESKLWFGNGYLAFWEHASSYFGSSSWMAAIGHAHNAYLEIILEVGIIGFIAQIVFLLLTCKRLFSGATRGDRDAASMLAIVLTLAVIGISGAVFFRPNSGLWIMTVAFACYAADTRAFASQRTPLSDTR